MASSTLLSNDHKLKCCVQPRIIFSRLGLSLPAPIYCHHSGPPLPHYPASLFLVNQIKCFRNIQTLFFFQSASTKKALSTNSQSIWVEGIIWLRQNKRILVVKNIEKEREIKKKKLSRKIELCRNAKKGKIFFWVIFCWTLFDQIQLAVWPWTRHWACQVRQSRRVQKVLTGRNRMVC